MFKGIEKGASKNGRAEFKNWSTSWFGTIAKTIQWSEEPQDLWSSQNYIILKSYHLLVHQISKFNLEFKNIIKYIQLILISLTRQKKLNRNTDVSSEISLNSNNRTFDRDS